MIYSKGAAYRKQLLDMIIDQEKLQALAENLGATRDALCAWITHHNMPPLWLIEHLEKKQDEAFVRIRDSSRPPG